MDAAQEGQQVTQSQRQDTQRTTIQDIQQNATQETTNTQDTQQTPSPKKDEVLDTLKTKLNDPATDFSQRDGEGRSLLHQAVLAWADTHLLKELSQRVDLTLRDVQGRTVLDLLLDLPGERRDEVSGLREAVEGRVREMVVGGGEEGEREARRMVLSGWSVWPLTPDQARDTSEEAAAVLERLMELKDQVVKVHRAVQKGDQADLQQLLTPTQSLPLVTAPDHTGLPPLHKTVLLRKGELLKFFVSAFSDSLNVVDYVGRTALHYAAALTENPELFQTLKDAGADDSIADLTGKTAANYQQSPDLLPVADVLKRVQEGTTTSSADDARADASNTAADSTTAPAQQVSEDEHPQETQKASPLPRPRNPSPPQDPVKPLEVKPVTMYVAGRGRGEEERAPPPTTVDGRYVAQHLGSALTMALAEIAEKRPWDPIEYLAQWLYKHRQNLDHMEKQKNLLDEIRAEEDATNAEEVLKFKRMEEQKSIQEERVRKEEEEAARKKREQEELQRQAKEALAAQQPQLPTVREEDGEDGTGMERERERDDRERDELERDELGRTELHLLAAQSGADLVTLLNLGHSLADRDGNDKTARDLAEEHGLTENVETLDNYVSSLLDEGEVDAVRQLVLDGYDHLDTILATVSTDDRPSAVTDFLNSIPDLQERVSAVLKAVRGGVEREVENTLERKDLGLAKDSQGRCPLHLALLAGHHGIARTLVNSCPLSLKARDNLNRTPLHYAAALSEEMTEFLKEHGADTNAKDAKQRLPAYYTEHTDDIVQLKTTLAAGTGDISLAVPLITADDNGQADDNQNKEEQGEQGEEPRQTDPVLATTPVEPRAPGHQ